MDELELTVGGAASSHASTTPIEPAAWQTWLGQLSPAALRAVLAQSLVRGPLVAVPGVYREQALELGPQVAALVAAQEAAMRAKPAPPALVELPDRRLFYSAGGASYRLVADAVTAAALELNPAGRVPVEQLPLPQAGVWPARSTPGSAFAEVGKIVAASGDVTAAYRFASLWRRRVAAAA